MADIRVVEKTTVTSNDFTAGLDVYLGKMGAGYADFEVWSTSAAPVAVVWVQKSRNSGSTWVDIESFTTSAATKQYHKTYVFGSAHQIRAGIKSGGYTSGTLNIRIAQGGKAI